MGNNKGVEKLMPGLGR